MPIEQPCQQNSNCNEGFECLDRRCIFKCQRVICVQGKVCVNGICKTKCSFHRDCSSGEICQEGYCEDACSFVKCP